MNKLTKYLTLILISYLLLHISNSSIISSNDKYIIKCINHVNCLDAVEIIIPENINNLLINIKTKRREYSLKYTNPRFEKKIYVSESNKIKLGDFSINKESGLFVHLFMILDKNIEICHFSLDVKFVYARNSQDFYKVLYFNKINQNILNNQIPFPALFYPVIWVWTTSANTPEIFFCESSKNSTKIDLNFKKNHVQINLNELFQDGLISVSVDNPIIMNELYLYNKKYYYKTHDDPVVIDNMLFISR